MAARPDDGRAGYHDTDATKDADDTEDAETRREIKSRKKGVEVRE